MTRSRIDLRSLLCKENSDEVGLFETDEVLVFHRAYRETETPPRFKKWRKENVDEGDWAIAAKRPLVLWGGALTEGESVTVECVIAEEGGGGAVSDVLGILTDLFGPGIPGLGDLVSEMAERNDDYIGSFTVRVRMQGGRLLKKVRCGKHSKIGGTPGWGHLSKTRRTVRVRMTHWLPGDNEVNYHASLNVWDLDTAADEPLVWTASEGAKEAE